MLTQYIRKFTHHILYGFDHLKRYYDNNFNIIFITGVSGSGTTLLYRLIYQRYEVAASISSTFSFPYDSPLRMKEVDAYQSLRDYYEAVIIVNSLSNIVLQSLQLNAYRNRVYRKKKHPPKKSTTILDKAPILHQARAKKLKSVFPKSKFILIFRNPIMSIEGMIRKWNLYRNTDLSELCDFWELLHRDFLTNTSDFASGAMGVSYE